MQAQLSNGLAMCVGITATLPKCLLAATILSPTQKEMMNNDAAILLLLAFVKADVGDTFSIWQEGLGASPQRFKWSPSP